MQRLKHRSWESWDPGLSKPSRSNWHQRCYKGRIHGTWWQLDNRLDMSSEDNSTVLGDPECFKGTSNVFLLLLRYTWESWAWTTKPCDIWPPDSRSSVTDHHYPSNLLCYKCTDLSIPWTPRLLPNSMLPNATYGINALCLASSPILWLIHVLSRLQFMGCSVWEFFPASIPRWMSHLLYAPVLFCTFLHGTKYNCNHSFNVSLHH